MPNLDTFFQLHLTKDGQVLLGLRKKASNNLGEKLIAGIGEKQEPNDTLDQAFVREFNEETKIEISGFKMTGQITFLFPGKPKWNQTAHVYLCTDSNTELQGDLQETESRKPEWFDIDNILWQRMWPDNQECIELVLDGNIVNAKFLLDDDAKVLEREIGFSPAI